MAEVNFKSETIKSMVNSVFMLYLSENWQKASLISNIVNSLAELTKEYEIKRKTNKIIEGKNNIYGLRLSTLEEKTRKTTNPNVIQQRKKLRIWGQPISYDELTALLQKATRELISSFFFICTKHDIEPDFSWSLLQKNQMSELPAL